MVNVYGMKKECFISRKLLSNDTLQHCCYIRRLAHFASISGGQCLSRSNSTPIWLILLMGCNQCMRYWSTTERVSSYTHRRRVHELVFFLNPWPFECSFSAHCLDLALNATLFLWNTFSHGPLTTQEVRGNAERQSLWRQCGSSNYLKSEAQMQLESNWSCFTMVTWYDTQLAMALFSSWTCTSMRK